MTLGTSQTSEVSKTSEVYALPEMRRGTEEKASPPRPNESQRGRALAALSVVQSRTNSNRPAPWAWSLARATSLRPW